MIQPDQVLNAGGKLTMRRVDTGHKGSKDHDSLAAAAFLVAADAHMVIGIGKGNAIGVETGNEPGLEHRHFFAVLVLVGLLFIDSRNR